MQQGLVKGGQPLLAVQQKTLGRALRFGLRTLDHAALEPDFATGLQHHEGTDGKAARDAGQQTANAVVVPHPAALKIRQLDFAAVGVIQE